MACGSALVSMYDEYRCLDNLLLQNDCTSEFLIFVKNQEQIHSKWRESIQEYRRLKAELDESNLKIVELEKKLNRARVLLDSEKKSTLQAESERDELKDYILQIENIMLSIRNAGDKLANETKERLDKFLTTTHLKLRPSTDNQVFQLHPVEEINDTASLLSDLSYTRSEDNIDISLSERGAFKKPKRSLSPHQKEILIKKRRSSKTHSRVKKIKRSSTGQLVATTTVTLPKTGPVLACSKIETFSEPNYDPLKPSAPPPKSSSETDSDVTEALKQFPVTPITNFYTSNKLFTRIHCFKSKTMLKPGEECGVCFKKIAFSNKFVYCPDCRLIAHLECRDKVSLPCITVVETPRGTSYTSLGDYCSKGSPMIPPLIIHCIIEVEERGLREIGLYRIPGSERDVKALKDRFLRGKGVCCLSNYDIHVICGTIKDFLRSLNEPLVTYSLRPDFIRAIEQEDASDIICSLCQTIAGLPQPNRDTLAFIMQHLQRVAQSPDCKMPKSNLAKVFGPTIVGYSSLDLGKSEMYNETSHQARVIEHLLDIPSKYWHNFINENVENVTPIRNAAFPR